MKLLVGLGPLDLTVRLFPADSFQTGSRTNEIRRDSTVRTRLMGRS